MSTPRPTSSDVYYSGTYWNARVEVVEYMNESATGDPAVHWWQALRTWHGRPFKRALALNCGNGWVERDLISSGVIESAVGIDIGADLLKVARAAAAEQGMPIEYIETDINTYDFDLDGIDLVINYAAAHHIAYIDQVFRHLARLLGPDGVFVSYDYVGPHRNQYPTAQYEAMWAANQALPTEFQRDLKYAHLPAMLAGDPTEAIHSELIVSTMRRYFDLPIERYLGGGVAYEVLSFNPAFHDPARDARELVQQVLTADREFRDMDPAANSLFAYVVAVPKPLPDQELLHRWTTDEHEREAQAAHLDGQYYPSTMIAEFADQRYRLENELRLALIPEPWGDVLRRVPGVRRAAELVRKVPGGGKLLGATRRLLRRR